MPVGQHSTKQNLDFTEGNLVDLFTIHILKDGIENLLVVI